MAHEAGKGPGRRAGADDAAYREGHDRIDWGAKGGDKRDGVRYSWLEDSDASPGMAGPVDDIGKPSFIWWCREAGPIGPLIYLFDMLVYHLARIGEDK